MPWQAGGWGSDGACVEVEGPDSIGWRPGQWRKRYDKKEVDRKGGLKDKWIKWWGGHWHCHGLEQPVINSLHPHSMLL